MIFKKAIKSIALAAMMFTGIHTANAQDMLARQAPVDRKMKAVDTLALRSLIEREHAQTPGMDLYEDWNNQYAHRATELPDSFRVNMRNFCMPTTSRVITSNYGARWGRQHKGIDVKVYIGDTIRAAFSGKVRIVKYESNGYGNYVVIRHNNGLETIYGHLSKHLCKENQTVKAGDVIGLGGNTGRSTGSHLHFETRICGVALDPAILFDFRNQDVTCDYYMFRKADYERKNGRQRIVASRSAKAEEEVAETKSNETSEPANDPKAGRDEMIALNTAKDKKDKKEKKDKKVKTHKVVKGDTLYSIAKKNNISVNDLCRLNGISKNAKLSLGQKIRI